MAKKRAAADGISKMNPAALSPTELASILMAAGAKGDVAAAIAGDLAAGAPRNADGSVHLIHYTAWLSRQAA